MRYLLIWEEIPENTKAYILTDDNPELLELARQSHGYYVNADDNAAVHQLSEELDKLEGSDYDGTHGGHEKIVGPFQEVFICGFIM